MDAAYLLLTRLQLGSTDWILICAAGAALVTLAALSLLQSRRGAGGREDPAKPRTKETNERSN